MLEKCYAELVEYSLRTKMKPFLPYFYSFIPTKNVVLGLKKLLRCGLIPPCVAAPTFRQMVRKILLPLTCTCRVLIKVC